jgi:DNA-directed RNA polymerase specialized sigma54-like protein
MPNSLQTSLQQMQAGKIKMAEFTQAWREQNPLLPQLPEKYHRVLDDLLMRLESSQLFSGEACAFSQTDLLNSLQTWLDKAEQYLAKQTNDAV